MRKTRIKAAFLFTLVLATALPARAQSNASGQVSSAPEFSLKTGLLRKDVKDQDGKTIGVVEDVIFTRHGRISLVLVDMGGFLGYGVKTVALNPNQTRLDDHDNFVFSGTRGDLENMPEINPYVFRRPYRGFYGPHGRGPIGRPDHDGQDRWAGTQDRQEHRQQAPTGYYKDFPQDSGMAQGRMQGVMSSWISSDFFLGAPVFNPRKKYIGEVEDLVVNPATDRITHAVIEVGGFLGIDSKKVLVPFDRLARVSPDYVIYPGSKRQLERMPAYQRGEGGRNG
jgi:sporulation protein YlmC with PRC-barrel domain